MIKLFTKESNSLFFFNIDEPGMPTNESFEIVFIRSALNDVNATTLVILLLSSDLTFDDFMGFVRKILDIKQNKNMKTSFPERIC